MTWNVKSEKTALQYTCVLIYTGDSELHFKINIACYRPNGNYCRFCCKDI